MSSHNEDASEESSPHVARRFLPPFDGFARSVAILAGGTAAAQLIALAISPLLTRLYRPDQIGEFAVYLSIILIGLPLATLSYEMAIPLPESREDGASLLFLALLCALGGSGVLAAASLLAGEWAAHELGLADLGSALWVLPVGLFIASSLQAITYWSIREGDFSSIARSRLAQSSSSAAVQIGAGLLGGGTLGMALGDMCGRSVGSLVLLFTSIRRSLIDWSRIDAKRIRRVASRYRRFPLFQSWGGTFNTLTSYLPVVLVTIYFQLSVAGEFALAVRVLQAPALLLGSAVAQAYLNQAADLARDDPALLLRRFDRLTRRLFTIGLVPAVALGLFSPTLFPAIFGSSWEAAGSFGQLLAPMLLALLTVSPLSMTLNVLELQSWQSAWDVGRTILVLGGLVVTGSLGATPTTAITVFSIASTVSYASLYLLARQGLKRKSIEAVPGRTGF